MEPEGKVPVSSKNPICMKSKACRETTRWAPGDSISQTRLLTSFLGSGSLRMRVHVLNMYLPRDSLRQCTRRTLDRSAQTQRHAVGVANILGFPVAAPIQVETNGLPDSAGSVRPGVPVVLERNLALRGNDLFYEGVATST
jgi:hypothetical protein